MHFCRKILQTGFDYVLKKVNKKTFEQHISSTFNNNINTQNFAGIFYHSKGSYCLGKTFGILGGPLHIFQPGNGYIEMNKF